MKKYLQGLLLIVFFLVLAQGINSEEPAPVGSKNCLWKVTSKTNTVYLLGSIHFLKKENYPLGKPYENAYNNSKILIVEADTSGGGQEERIAALTKRLGFYNKGKTLNDVLSTETYKLAKAQMESSGLDISKYSNAKPWFLALMIYSVKLQSYGFSPEFGVDNYFMKRSRAEGKKIIQLETAEYQLNLFNTLPEKTQEMLLLQTIKEIEMTEKEASTVVNSWLTGDDKTLKDVLLSSFKDYPELYQKILTDRNNSWLPKIENFLRRRDNYLVVVGTGHLIGDNGLVNQLKERGYEVIRQ
ncbi:TraB/GumN family protein [Candidatus Magnetomonas plexicatena]|uniref:TraB/GumN family protein n=1 Tax=Candidatus Magnetomonas plexicatena TaxID=2552947 RepID=UPI001101C482|nr:TraB/GumN family protein [Nitrospirales bacterium LBB_01]